jgi:DNA ligase (NAD+)
VLAVVHEARPEGTQPWVPPTHCPSCSASLVTQRPGCSSQPGQLFCVNRGCPAQSSARLRYFASKMDIQGLGPRTLELLLALRPELEVPDLYSLTLVSTWPARLVVCLSTFYLTGPHRLRSRPSMPR